MILEVMPDTAGVAHSTCRDDDMKAREAGDGLAFLNALGGLDQRRLKRMEERFTFGTCQESVACLEF